MIFKGFAKANPFFMGFCRKKALQKYVFLRRCSSKKGWNLEAGEFALGLDFLGCGLKVFFLIIDLEEFI